MYKIIRNIIPKTLCFEAIKKIKVLSKKTEIFKKKDSYGEFAIQIPEYNDFMRSDEIKKILFSEELIKKIKEEVGKFTFINFIQCKINGFGADVHRDGQSFGFSYDALKKSSSIIKVLFYLYPAIKIPNSHGLDVNLIDLNLKNIFFNKRIYMKINYYYEYYLRSRLMKNLKLNLGDVIIMDNNTWHRASINKFRQKSFENFECQKIYFQYEIVKNADKNVVDFYSKHVNDNFRKIDETQSENEININLLDQKYRNIFLDQGLDVQEIVPQNS
jgi:hypothetical protein